MSMNSAVELLDRVKFWAIVSAAALFGVAMLFAAYLSRTVTKPIGELVQAAARIGEGDLTVWLAETSRDEIGLLQSAFNRMVEGIVKLEETEHRMEKSELASQLAARMAHEIKNPLNSIGLIVDLMGDRYAPKSAIDKAAIKKLSDDLKEELSRLNDIVEGFLRFARPTEVSLRPTNIEDLLRETLDFIRAEAEAQNAEISLSIEPTLPAVMADYGQFRQALMNLLINAVQAMPQGGNIQVRVLNLNGHVQVVIEDTGCGIPKENLPRLFDPYFTTKVRGFGLGLSIVERIVEDYAGSIAVNSEVGKGATFTIILPAIAAETIHHDLQHTSS